MNKIGFSIGGLKQLERKLGTLSDKMFKDIDAAIEDTADQIVKKAKQRAPINDGLLRQGIGSRKENGVWIVFSNAYHAGYVEFGTRGKVRVPAGLESVAQDVKNQPKRGDYFDFVEAIYKWVIKKGIGATYNVSTRRKNRQSRDEKLAIALAIADSILRNGIEPQPYFYNTWFEERPKLSREIKNIIKREVRK